MSHRTDPLLVGVDVGTTNIKALIFTPAGEIVAQHSVPTSTHYPQPGWAYYDPEELWQQTAAAIRQSVDEVENPERIASIAIASIGETGVPLDDAGAPTYDAIAWFDRRTEPQLAWLDETIGADQLFAITGLGLASIFSLCKLLWLRQNEPDAYQRTRLWLNTADYIAYRLCGVPATDYSLASRTLALDIHGKEWATDLLRDVGLSPDLFAPLCDSGIRLGHVTTEAAHSTGLPTSVSVVAGGHDHVVGAFAVGVNQPGHLLISMGTTEASFLPLSTPLTDPRAGHQGYTQGAHVSGDYYVLGGQYTAGGSVEWFRNAIAGGEDYSRLFEEAEAVAPGSLGVQFLPHLRQASAPHADVKGKGAFVGLSTDVTRRVLFRALLEGVSFESRLTLEPQLAYAGLERPEEIVAVGGGTRNPLHMRIKATLYNQRIAIVSMEEATALGAALLGGVGAGIYADREAGVNAISLTRTMVEPVTDQVSTYERLYQNAFRFLYPSLRSIHHSLHDLQDG